MAMSIEIAKKVLETEGRAVLKLIEKVGKEFEKAEDIIFSAKGRVIVTGIGKSGIVGRKIAATLSSIGVPSFFLHPSEGAHGDLGMIMKGDIAIVISKSGSTEELNSILNHLKRLEIPVISFTSSTNSSLAAFSDVVLDVSVDREACPFDIIPTASTTAALALGDALAISLLIRKGITAEDFAVLHPGGSIGRGLTYKVKDLMVSGEDMPVTDIDSKMNIVIDIMSGKKMGIAVLTEQGKLSGVITDGDLRRLIQRTGRPLELTAREALEKTARENQKRTPPLTIESEAYIVRAVNLMEKHVVTAIVVTDSGDEPVGLIRWIDLSRAGIV